VAIQLIRLYTGEDGESHFDVGRVGLHEHEARNMLSHTERAGEISFEETQAGSSLDWHCAPQRQYVITLSGRLEFETRDGSTQVLGPGEVLLAEDTRGGGHRWRLIDDQPWRRAYVTLMPLS
jgi:quercetin dioxygenase-like cupin family protein